jgi:hypothetical protein
VWLVIALRYTWRDTAKPLPDIDIVPFQIGDPLAGIVTAAALGILPEKPPVIVQGTADIPGRAVRLVKLSVKPPCLIAARRGPFPEPVQEGNRRGHPARLKFLSGPPQVVIGRILLRP